MLQATCPMTLEEIVISVYSAIDDALIQAGISVENGKLIPRRGPAPEVDDREILCLSLLQEILGFESDNRFYLWFENNTLMCELFPRRIKRQKWAERRALLTPILQLLCAAFCELAGEASPPLPLSTPTQLTFAG